jgi:transcriptional regulator with XRE-family HTH domain
MKTTNSDLIKNMRKEMNMSQEEMAEQLYISVRHLQRIESGQSDIEMWQIVSMLELMGRPTEDFWTLYLDTEEYNEYRMYRHLRTLLHVGKLVEVEELLPEFEKRELSQKLLPKQFIAYAKILLDKEISTKEAIEKLYEVIRMSKSNFDENKIITYRLTDNEINALIEIAGRFAELGDLDAAIAIQKAMIESSKKFIMSEEGKASALPTLMSNHSTVLGRAKRYKESLKCCEEALEISREHAKATHIPVLLKNMASCHRLLGEEEDIWLPLLRRAYHCAYALGKTEQAKRIKKSAEEDFGITNL